MFSCVLFNYKTHTNSWPCLSQWLESRNPSSNKCPVCKAGISKENVIPVYGKNCSDKTDPRTKPRPQAKRPQPTYQPFQPFGVPTGPRVCFFNSTVIFNCKVILNKYVLWNMLWKSLILMFNRKSLNRVDNSHKILK